LRFIRIGDTKETMKLWNQLLDLLFPPKCAFCKSVLKDGDEELCDKCKKDLPFIDDPHVIHKGDYGRCAVTFYYEEMVKTGIHGLKFGGRQHCVAHFARYMAQTVAEHLSGEFDAVTFVPVSAKRLRERGYDQSALLAEEMAKIWGVEVLPTLKKIRHTKAQSSIAAPEERRANVLGAYAPLETAEIEGKRLLLVDDVLTTGSTMSACASVLRRAGAAGVVCATLAAPRKKT